MLLLLSVGVSTHPGQELWVNLTESDLNPEVSWPGHKELRDSVPEGSGVLCLLKIPLGASQESTFRARTLKYAAQGLSTNFSPVVLQEGVDLKQQ